MVGIRKSITALRAGLSDTRDRSCFVGRTETRSDGVLIPTLGSLLLQLALVILCDHLKGYAEYSFSFTFSNDVV